MKKITLTQGQCAIVDDNDYEYLMQWKWCAHWKHKTNSFIAVRTSLKGEFKRKVTVLMHRVVVDAKKDEYIDHKDHNTLNNTRLNLRKCTNSQNMMNMSKPKDNTSGMVGVTWSKSAKKWQAQIQHNKKPVYLGVFSDIKDAIKARKSAEQKYFGEYSYDNSTLNR